MATSKKEIQIPLQEWFAKRKQQKYFNSLIRKALFLNFRKGKTSIKDFIAGEIMYYQCKVQATISDIKYLTNKKNWW